MEQDRKPPRAKGPAPGFSARNRDAERLLVEVCLASDEDALGRMETGVDGLAGAEAEARLAVHGENQLAVVQKHHLLKDLAGRIKDPLVIQLLVICVVSGLMGDARAAIMVGGMIFLSVFLSYVQERRSSRAVEKLQKLVQTTARVLRDGPGDRGPDRRGRARRHRRAGRRRHHPRRSAHPRRQGFLRQPIGPDRRVHAGGEGAEEHRPRATTSWPSPTPASRAATS